MSDGKIIHYNALEDESGDLYIRVADLREFCTEFLIGFNELNAPTSLGADNSIMESIRAAAADGIRCAFERLLVQLDDIETKYEREYRNDD